MIKCRIPIRNNMNTFVPSIFRHQHVQMRGSSSESDEGAKAAGVCVAGGNQ